jgi:arylsulfatase A-like enzyme
MKWNKTISKLSAAGLAGAGCAYAVPENRPNIIVILTDDWGYGDLGANGALADVLTPNLDRLAKSGVLFTDGYCTAPQCSPSRAGLMTGRYQQRFGFDSIIDGPLPLEEVTIAERLKAAGYATGMVGKWHLEPNPVTVRWANDKHPELERFANGQVKIPEEIIRQYMPGKQGFSDFYTGEMLRYWANYSLDGRDLYPLGEPVNHSQFRVLTQTSAALAFLERNKKSPFFLYVGYFSPHVPLEAPEEFAKRFPGKMPERRRAGLALMSAVDDGVGQMVAWLEKEGLRENTLIVFSSDNGAPLGAMQGDPMQDVLPVGKAGPAWDGSRNDPLRGEKGMLSEGGIRIPLIAAWPKVFPPGQIYSHPINLLDITVTANAAAGLPDDPIFDGVNLIPYLTGEKTGAPQRDLFWKFWNQAAVRSGDWKFIQIGRDISLLFNLKNDKEENNNVIGQYPEVAAELKRKLEKWAADVQPAGLPRGGLNEQEQKFYKYWFNKE